MKTTTKKSISKEQAIKNGNSVINQKIKGDFVGKHVFACLTNVCEYLISNGFEDRESPLQYDEIENLYSYPEWSVSLLGEDLYFNGGSQEQRDEFLEEFTRLENESSDLFDNEEISEETHERNLKLIQDEKENFEALEQAPEEIFEWWAVSSWLYEKLQENGYCVADLGSCKVWGRTTTGQAILLDGVITHICADMEILEGQSNSWA